ncbi:RNAse III, putative [Candida dubliniensis CD36]|uniref:ribonuclease III n=1 Tax=Candida dubliniensis (strain CD36 / ATCC MYA-646 / CBS 7987 / NCPF 3949 / NRRL Y-17841) TaxID=573826 RepID=B9WGE5_CANDC|nr:RNAse III, putative [Candida dubliniensis CD36]CAX42319.1 RNAse III, putative [Candida dubliniensis CD36]
MSSFSQKNLAAQNIAETANKGFMSYIHNWTSTSQQEDNKVISSNLDDLLSVSDIDSDTSMSTNNSSKNHHSSKRSSPAPIPSTATKKAKITDAYLKELSAYHEPVFDRPPPTTIGILDMNQLEHSTKTMQKCVSSILEKAPNCNQLQYLIESNEIDNSTRIELQDNPLISTATKLKSLHEIGKLPILDQIINDEVEISENDLKNLKKVPVKSNSVKVNSHRDTVPEIESTGVDHDMPPLPPIKDPKLFERVFVHRSTVNNKQYLEANQLLHSHNERLEFYGDSILNNLVTLIIFKEFPDSAEGDLSKIRSRLVNNKTLVKFAFQYGFDKKLRTRISENVLKTGDQKIFADVFEAYIGALALEKGLEVEDVKEWLAKLYAPLIHELKIEYIEDPIDREAKSKLYALIGQDDLHPIYNTIQMGDGINHKFIVQCTINGEELGRGSANSLKEAGLRAAMAGLNNTEILKKYFVARQQIERPIKLQRLERENAKKREIAERLEQEKNNLPSTPSSPIRTSMFPIPVNENEPLDIDAKNKLYGILGRKIGDKPIYLTSQVNGNLFRVVLNVRSILICEATDPSKKKAMARVAQTLLENESAMREICKDFRTRDSPE